MTSRRLAPWLCLLALSGTTACATWKVQQAPPAEVLATPRDHVRLTMSDGTVHAVQDARVEGDRVVGRRPESSTAGRTVSEISFALADVRRVDVSEGNTGKALLLAGGVIVGAMLLIGATSCYGC